jgi:hypothetical protein
MKSWGGGGGGLIPVRVTDMPLLLPFSEKEAYTDCYKRHLWTTVRSRWNDQLIQIAAITIQSAWKWVSMEVTKVPPLHGADPQSLNATCLLLHAFEVLGKPRPSLIISSNDDVVEESNDACLARGPVRIENRTRTTFRLHSTSLIPGDCQKILTATTWYHTNHLHWKGIGVPLSGLVTARVYSWFSVSLWKQQQKNL